MKSYYVVKAVFDSPFFLAAFQYLEWAEEWRDKMCATGVIFKVEETEVDRQQEQVSKEVMPHATGLRPGPCESPQSEPTGKASQVSTGANP